MSSKHRLLRSFHFEQPFSFGATAPGGDTPVVGAIVTGPLGALVQRAFSAAFTSVLRAQAAVAAKPVKPRRKSAQKTSPAPKSTSTRRKPRRGGRGFGSPG